MSNTLNNIIAWLNKVAPFKNQKLLILLDYDGTLVPICNRPEDAKISSQNREILKDLSLLPNVRLCIISGRDSVFLLSQLDSINIDIGIEHGAELRLYEQDKLIPLTGIINSEIRKDIEKYFSEKCIKIPGTNLEVKKYSVAWHYRNASTILKQEFDEIIDHLECLLKNLPLKLLLGNMVIEVRQEGTNKGIFLEKYLEILGPKFINFGLLAFGDDTTDEDLFTVINEKKGFSVRVGAGQTVAIHTLSHQSELESVLRGLYAHLQLSSPI